MPIVPSLQIEFVREVLADLFLSSVTPAEVVNDGGTTLRLDGRYKTDFPTTVEVMVGATPYVCYSAAYGSGDAPFPLGENILFCATPQLPIGGPYDVRVTQDGTTVSVTGALTVVARNGRSRVFGLRRLLPPTWRKGPSALDKEDVLITGPVLHPIENVFFSQSIPGQTFVPQVLNPVPFTWSSVGTALPGWASLDPATGTISGTPTVLDVGTTAGVQLRADDGAGSTYDTLAFNLTVG